MNKRVHAYYSGQVQMVGFRYTSHSIAKRLLLSGWVKNLPDGRVELVAEGDEATLNDLLKEIKEQLNYCRFKENVEWSDATGEFKEFGIRF
jgi:acylphosphatase